MVVFVKRILRLSVLSLLFDKKFVLSKYGKRESEEEI